MRLCKQFDKYRDGELDPAERTQFEFHLKECADCSTKIALLNNLVLCLKAEEAHPGDIAARIAHKAFEKRSSWDAEVISWLRPGPALAALTLMIALFSSLWVVSRNRQAMAYSEYEKLMEKADSAGYNSRISLVGNDKELVIWLQQEESQND
jgi:anti-sigma factor RsiW